MNYISADDNVDDLQEMRIILLGRTDGRKSVLGDSICGSQKRNFPFENGISSSSVTQIPKIAYREYGDRKVCVIDTSGLFDTNRSNEETMNQLTIAFQLANPGPHAFLIVLSGRCTDEEINILNLLKKKFGEYFLDYCFIIITRDDDIRYNDIQSSDDQIIQKYFQEAPQILQEFRVKYNHRCFLINNRASFEERERKIGTIIQMIKYNEDQHPNTFFNQEMFDQAQRYDQEWNNKQYHYQQKEIEAEFKRIGLIQHLCELDQGSLEKHRSMIESVFDEEQSSDEKDEEPTVKITAKTTDMILSAKFTKKRSDK